MELQHQLFALLQVIVIDIVLAGDNAVVVGMAAARVDPRLRAKVIVWGVGGAVILRILFAVVATQLLAIVGLMLAGGILLLWVCWKMYRDIRAASHSMEPALAGVPSGSGAGESAKTITFTAALIQIVVADVSMSLDNVLAVAGAAKGDMTILVIGLVVAVAFMGFMSHYIARLLGKYAWISWIGLLIILYVAFDMIWQGSKQVGCQFVPAATCNQGALAILQTLL